LRSRADSPRLARGRRATRPDRSAAVSATGGRSTRRGRLGKSLSDRQLADAGVTDLAAADRAGGKNVWRLGFSSGRPARRRTDQRLLAPERTRYARPQAATQTRLGDAAQRTGRTIRPHGWCRLPAGAAGPRR